MNYSDLNLVQISMYNKNNTSVWVEYPMDNTTVKEFMEDDYMYEQEPIDFVEKWGKERCLLCSENEVSDYFDAYVRDVFDDLTYHEIKDDDVYIKNEFYDYLEILRDKGEIHQEQVNTYSYTNNFHEIK